MNANLLPLRRDRYLEPATGSRRQSPLDCCGTAAPQPLRSNPAPRPTAAASAVCACAQLPAGDGCRAAPRAARACQVDEVSQRPSARVLPTLPAAPRPRARERGTSRPGNARRLWPPQARRSNPAPRPTAAASPVRACAQRRAGDGRRAAASATTPLQRCSATNKCKPTAAGVSYPTMTVCRLQRDRVTHGGMEHGASQLTGSWYCLCSGTATRIRSDAVPAGGGPGRNRRSDCSPSHLHRHRAGRLVAAEEVRP